jgi:hypothetical protein
VSIDSRLTKLTPALTARERGVLLLKALKGELEEDPAWRSTMPRDQYADFNHYIALMNTANISVAHVVTFVEEEAEKAELVLCWLMSLRLWEVNLAAIEFEASLLAREPVTESEHKRLLKKAADEYLSVSEAGERLAETARAWSDDDLEDLPGLQERFVKDDAWRRLCREGADEVRAAVAAGEVEARGRGSSLRVRQGSLDAWLGRPLRPYPEWAGGYEVRPDSEADLVEQDRQTLGHLRRTTTDLTFAEVEGERFGLSTMIEGLEKRLRNVLPLRWRDARTAEVVLDQIAAEFGGEDPLKPATREALEAAKATLRGCADYFKRLGPEVELREPTEEDLALGQELLEKGRRLFG